MENKNSSVLHHVEVCVQDETKFLDLFTRGFGFKVSYCRSSSVATQWVLKSGNGVFVVTKHGTCNEVTNSQESNGHDGQINSTSLPVNNCVNGHKEPEIENSFISDIYPYLFCTSVRKEHALDTVFNIALEVKNMDKICDNIRKYGGRMIQELCTINDKNGPIRLAIVESKCENVIITLIDKSNYSGHFLPGFTKPELLETGKIVTENSCNSKTRGSEKSPTDFMDHISLVCRAGESKDIVDWFQKCFGMQRFFANSQDTVEEGFVLEDVIGLRMKALQYWRCAETGVTPGSDLNDPRTLKIVIGEPLPNVENGQIKLFLEENAGPGVQHIALHCNNIVGVVSEMKQRGVNFRMPPPTYYDEISKLNEILEVNVKKSFEEFSESGVLLDVEEDLLSKEDKNRYLLQIFTFPIFEKDAFFMEVIQRDGATGFGAGNISALARSIFRYQEEMKNKNKN